MSILYIQRRAENLLTPMERFKAHEKIADKFSAVQCYQAAIVNYQKQVCSRPIFGSGEFELKCGGRIYRCILSLKSRRGWKNCCCFVTASADCWFLNPKI